MSSVQSFDILLLGLKDGSSAGRRRYANAMERLTGKEAGDFQVPSTRSREPIFKSLDQSTARVVVGALGEAGALLQIRPTKEVPTASEKQVITTETCPSCGFVQAPEAVECARCGLVFSKFEREQVQSMQKEQHLEEALSKALQSREEWAQKAKQYLEKHPLAGEALEGFGSVVMRDEVPFLRLTAEEGPILMTSRRLIASLKEGFFSIPYEIVSDVTVGGGLVQKKSRVRLQLSFHSAVPTPSGSNKQATWQLDKESSFFKDVIMDWCFARVFMCGVCGQRDLDFRSDGSNVRARCMHCATDHDIDLREALAIPLPAA